jgi:tRNA (adenine-N(1)-)-methyltransferase non-catalytic subunit
MNLEEKQQVGCKPANIVQQGDWILLCFADGKRVFAQCLKNPRGKIPAVKINKRCYSSHHLIGLPYGTVLELGQSTLTPLPEGQDVLPDHPLTAGDGDESQDETATSTPPLQQFNDNRHLMDNNTSQALKQRDLIKLRQEGTEGSEIVAKLIQHSSTFDSKTDFSKAKYIARKQKKYQPRCRMVRCTGLSICQGKD